MNVAASSEISSSICLAEQGRIAALVHRKAAPGMIVGSTYTPKSVLRLGGPRNLSGHGGAGRKTGPLALLAGGRVCAFFAT
jgi:hypothetical protein